MSNVSSSPTSASAARIRLYMAMLVPCCLAAANELDRVSTDPASPTLLQPVNVLGSHIRRTEFEGPSSVRIYDREYIEASGAMRLADFLNLLPQNYGGASSGRGSAPNDLNPEFGVRTETTLPSFNFVLGMAAIPFGQTGVSAANLRGLGSGSTLVLVDGHRRPIAGQGNASTNTRQGFVNLNTIPLGMIERVEILADGASALYGSDAIGGVINVVLKKNYTGAELVTDYKGTFDGGGRERNVSLIAGFTSKDSRLRGTIGVDFYDRAPLTAAQRDFSADQDHSGRIIDYDADGDPIHGIDFRLNWSYPATVQAHTGTLNGVLQPDGTPATVALVPDGARDPLTPAEFIGSPATRAEGARRMNTAAFISLISPQESRSVSGHFEYRFNENLRAQGGASLNIVETQFDGQPPVSSASASSGFGSYRTIVPAFIDGQRNTLNPFGQDVLVGLVHHEFGPTRQTTRTSSYGGYANLIARFGNWEWNAGVNASREHFRQRNLTLDLQKFSDALTAPDPAQRFNPFVDARVAGPVNAHLYESMKAIDARDGWSEYAEALFLASGPLRELPGGDLQLALGGNYHVAYHRAETRPALGSASRMRVDRDSFASFAELAIPLVGKPNALPLVHRLELQLAGRYEHHEGAGSTTNPTTGVVWNPASWLLLRTSVSSGFRAPSLTEYQTTSTRSTTTLTDPARGSVRTPGVTVERGSNPNALSEKSRSRSFGLVVTPPIAPGLSFALDYLSVRQRNVLQEFSPQSIVDNQAYFPNRITRLEPTDDDRALGRPGALSAVDASFVNFGVVHHESVDLELDYEIRSRRLGTFRFGASASRTLTATAELTPGVRKSDLLGDTGVPPRDRAAAQARWDNGTWNASVFARYIGSFVSNEAGNYFAPEGYPSMTTVNLNFGYKFRAGLWRGWAKDSRISVGFDNIFDRKPPFSDTIFGYNGGLHTVLGRAYSISFVLRF